MKMRKSDSTLVSIISIIIIALPVIALWLVTAFRPYQAPITKVYVSGEFQNNTYYIRGRYMVNCDADDKKIIKVEPIFKGDIADKTRIVIQLDGPDEAFLNQTTYPYQCSSYDAMSLDIEVAYRYDDVQTIDQAKILGFRFQFNDASEKEILIS